MNIHGFDRDAQRLIGATLSGTSKDWKLRAEFFQTLENPGQKIPIIGRFSRDPFATFSA
jgi:hypothetical protein